MTTRVTICILISLATIAVAQSPDAQRLVAEAQRLNDRVLELYSAGKYAEAIPLSEKVLALRLQALGERHLQTGVALYNLGSVCQGAARLEESRGYFERAIEVYRKHYGPEHVETIEVIEALGMTLSEMGRHAEAKRYYEQTLQIRRKTQGDMNEGVAETYVRLAAENSELGNYAEAKAQVEQAVAIRRRVLKPGHPDLGKALNVAGSIIGRTGDYVTARSYFEQALKIAVAAGKGHEDSVATALNNLGGAFESLGAYADARQCFERSHELFRAQFGEEHASTAGALERVALIRQAARDYNGARPLLERALQVKEKTLGVEHPLTAITYNNLGILLLRLNLPAEAEAAMRKGLAARRKVYGEAHQETALSLVSLGFAQQCRGDFPGAVKSAAAACAIYEKILGPDHPEAAMAFDRLAAFEAAAEDLPAALKHTDHSRRIARRHVSQMLPLLSELEQVAFLHEKESAARQAAFTLGLRAGDPAAETSAGWVLNGKGVAQETLARRAIAARDSRDPRAAALLAQLTTVRREAAGAAISVAPAGREKDWLRRSAELLDQERDLVRRLAELSVITSAGDPWVEVAAVRQALAAESLLIEFVRIDPLDFRATTDDKSWLPARYAAWIIPPAGRGEIKVIDLGEAAAIDAALAAARKRLEDVTKADDFAAAIRDLKKFADLAWRPLVPHFGEARELILSPDGELWLAPFAALPWSEREFVVERFTLRYVTSGRDLVAAPSPAAETPGTPVIFANPDFDQPAERTREAIRAVLRDRARNLPVANVAVTQKLPKVEPLPGTAKEAKLIAPSIERWTQQKPTVYEGGYALETVALHLRRPKTAVFSTHGYFLSAGSPLRRDEKTADDRGIEMRNPLLHCGLLFAGCNQRSGADGDDGVLTALEICGLDLRGTELVVLSACETGLGTVEQGEGVAGLRQAFQTAGARGVTSSLWSVPDRDSALIMGNFFQQLADGKHAAEALRQAQLARIAARREEFGDAHPLYWAAWTFTGR